MRRLKNWMIAAILICDDTGVIISYNTEGAGNGDNIVVLPGAISINPLNWKRDETYASAEENLGGFIACRRL